MSRNIDKFRDRLCTHIKFNARRERAVGCWTKDSQDDYGRTENLQNNKKIIASEIYSLHSASCISEIPTNVVSLLIRFSSNEN